MSECPYCQRSEKQVKAGRNESGSQRYRCQVCQRKYTPEPKVQGYSDEVRRQALQLYVDGMNFRRIGRTLGIMSNNGRDKARITAKVVHFTEPTAGEQQPHDTAC